MGIVSSGSGSGRKGDKTDILSMETNKLCRVLLLFVCCRDDDGIDQKSKTDNGTNGGGAQTAGTLSSANSLLDSSQTIAAIEYKKGYMMRKCCFEANKKSKLGIIGFGVVLWLFRMFSVWFI